MLRKLTHTATLMLAIALICISTVDARGGRNKPNRHRRPGQSRVENPGHKLAGLNLTEAQQAAVQAKIDELKAAGATREEIRAAVREMLESFGIELPEKPERDFGRKFSNLGLTDEQQAAVRQKIDDLHAAEASPEDIRVAVREMIAGFGIELPEKPERHLGYGLCKLDLTNERREAIRTEIEAMKAAGASREDIHTTVVATLEGFGITLPEDFRPHRKPGRGRGNGHKLSQVDLTEEQRAQIQETVKTMREDGAKKNEIRAAVAELLETFGVEDTENPFLRGDAGRGRHHRPGRHGLLEGFFLKELTREQRTEIHETVKTMRKDGATREEVRTAIVELLRKYGLLEDDQAAGDAAGDDAVADMAEVDAEIEAAPGISPDPELRVTTWGQLKSSR